MTSGQVISKLKHDKKYSKEVIKPLEKEHKVLRIIKKKLELGVVIIGDNPKLRIVFQNMLRFYDISQEEYDLLKEILL